MALPQFIINRNVLARRLSHLSHMLNAPNGTRGNYIGACTRCLWGRLKDVFFYRSLSLCMSLSISLFLSLSISLFLSPSISLSVLSTKRTCQRELGLINYCTNIDSNKVSVSYVLIILVFGNISYITLAFSLTFLSIRNHSPACSCHHLWHLAAICVACRSRVRKWLPISGTHLRHALSN